MITLLIGPGGSGKVSWARRHAKACGRLSDTVHDREYIYRVAGLRIPNVTEAPFRAPHHTVSTPAMIGTMRDGWRWHPGECSLAHGGTLLLDELLEFSRRVLGAVHGAYKEGFIRMSQRAPNRAGLSEGLSPYVVPCQFNIVATMLSCPCGMRSVDSSPDNCRCSDKQVASHLGRVPDWVRAKARMVHIMNGRVV